MKNWIESIKRQKAADAERRAAGLKPFVVSTTYHPVHGSRRLKTVWLKNAKDFDAGREFCAAFDKVNEGVNRSGEEYAAFHNARFAVLVKEDRHHD